MSGFNLCNSSFCSICRLTFAPPPAPPPSMEKNEEYNHRRLIIPQQDWFIKMISFLADIIYNCILALFSPFTLFFSTAFESYHRTEVAAAALESVVVKAPSELTHGSIMIVRRIAVGVVGAVHVLVVLMSVMVLAALLGFGLVQLWVEEPVLLKERLFFDYSDLNPEAVFNFDGVKRIPIGHTFHVSLELLMPESNYNRELGVFQLSAELLSANGAVIAKSSQPCMLTFRSLPIRLIRTCIMSIPLVLGISAETQKLSVNILNHKEGHPRTNAIRVTLIPRAGTSSLPQLYESKLRMISQLPWAKQFVRNWKWTVSVWAALYIYTLLLTFMLCCCRPLLFPFTMVSFGNNHHGERDTSANESKEPGTTEPRNEREISELMRKWQERRKKRKAIFVQRDGSVETVGSSASSICFTREDTSVFVEEDIGDSESVCLSS